MPVSPPWRATKLSPLLEGLHDDDDDEDGGGFFAFLRLKLVEELPTKFSRRARSACKAAASNKEDEEEEEGPLPLILSV